jgi:hypothetical protein
LILLGGFFLPSVAQVSQQNFWFTELLLSASALYSPSWISIFVFEVYWEIFLLSVDRPGSVTVIQSHITNSRARIPMELVQNWNVNSCCYSAK